MYNWYGLNQIEDDSWLHVLYWIDRGQQKMPRKQSTIPLLLTSVYPA